jgi:hypothetical protein
MRSAVTRNVKQELKREGKYVLVSVPPFSVPFLRPCLLCSWSLSLPQPEWGRHPGYPEVVGTKLG